jgi:hypothetical protein
MLVCLSVCLSVCRLPCTLVLGVGIYGAPQGWEVHVRLSGSRCSRVDNGTVPLLGLALMHLTGRWAGCDGNDASAGCGMPGIGASGTGSSTGSEIPGLWSIPVKASPSLMLAPQETAERGPHPGRRRWRWTPCEPLLARPRSQTAPA